MHFFEATTYMFGKVTAFSKSFVTTFKFAAKRLFSRMNTLVDSKRTRDGKFLGTSSFRASEGLFTCMSAHVLSHDVGLREAFVANVALIGFVTYNIE